MTNHVISGMVQLVPLQNPQHTNGSQSLHLSSLLLYFLPTLTYHSVAVPVPVMLLKVETEHKLQL